jgi:bifunctional non-homologous end joining protein LigD
MAPPSPASDIAVVLEQLEQPGTTQTITVAEHVLELTRLDKVLWPKHGRRRALTKRDLIRYYVKMADVLLPHLQDRTRSLLRYPTGITGDRFFQKHW